MEAHTANGGRVAEFLENHSRVKWANYPGLESSPYHALAKTYLQKGSGAILTFGIEGGLEAGKRFVNSLKMLSHLANVGDAKSLVIHPASTKHQQLAERSTLSRNHAGAHSRFCGHRGYRRHPLGSGSGFSSFGELVAGPWGEPGFGRAFMEDDELAGIQCLELPRRAAGPSNFEIYFMRSADAEVQAWIIGGVKAALT